MPSIGETRLQESCSSRWRRANTNTLRWY